MAEKKLLDLNVTVVALVALVAIVGVIAIMLNGRAMTGSAETIAQPSSVNALGEAYSGQSFEPGRNPLHELPTRCIRYIGGVKFFYPEGYIIYSIDGQIVCHDGEWVPAKDCTLENGQSYASGGVYKDPDGQTWFCHDGTWVASEYYCSLTSRDHLDKSELYEDGQTYTDTNGNDWICHYGKWEPVLATDQQVQTTPIDGAEGTPSGRTPKVPGR